MKEENIMSEVTIFLFISAGYCMYIYEHLLGVMVSRYMYSTAANSPSGLKALFV